MPPWSHVDNQLQINYLIFAEMHVTKCANAGSRILYPGSKNKQGKKYTLILGPKLTSMEHLLNNKTSIWTESDLQWNFSYATEINQGYISEIFFNKRETITNKNGVNYFSRFNFFNPGFFLIYWLTSHPPFGMHFL